MILIKDRHRLKLYHIFYIELGKYDTYKGSTLDTIFILVFHFFGTYDTYKGSTLTYLPIFVLTAMREI